MRTRTITIVTAAGLLAGLTACSSASRTVTAAGADPVPQPAVTQTVTATVTAPAPPAPPAPTVTVTVTATVAPPPATTAPPAGTGAGTGAGTAAKPEAGAAAPAEPADTIDGSGTFLVGTDIRPGTYRTAGPGGGSMGMCYWERARAADGDLGSIIANENLMGQGVVTIKKSDVVFKTQGCQPWTKIG
ncbi:hypothetical protein [Kitasatospora sp. NPDC057500]|uniref:hypothetical protein n=1 Tax=Kitasatospora sp. NPDC057500 TaxID=3346151 RepID=UPI0036A9AFF4